MKFPPKRAAQEEMDRVWDEETRRMADYSLETPRLFQERLGAEVLFLYNELRKADRLNEANFGAFDHPINTLDIQEIAQILGIIGESQR